MKTGHDERFRNFFPEEGEGWLDAKRSFFPINLAGFWTIQAMWAWAVSLPVTMANFAGPGAIRAAGGMGAGGWAWTGLFAAGLVTETLADMQKYRFKNDPANAGKFCDAGVWSLSRHPNYLGELTVWWGIFGLASPLLRAPRELALGLASPVFLMTLILFVSGVPLLEEQHDKKYGKDPRYQEYKANTPLLVPDFTKVFF
ncbi:unnamed protein product [Discosporangium mesarthrocarpum]